METATGQTPTRQFVKGETEKIKTVCAKHYGIISEMIDVQTRKNEVKEARQICHYLTKKIYGSNAAITVQFIGDMIGKQNHATVLNSVRKVSELSEFDKIFREKLKTIEDEVNEKVRLLPSDVEKANENKSIHAQITFNGYIDGDLVETKIVFDRKKKTLTKLIGNIPQSVMNGIEAIQEFRRIALSI